MTLTDTGPGGNQRGFDAHGWRLALIGAALGSIAGLLKPFRMGGHATAGEYLVVVSVAMLALVPAAGCLVVSASIRVPAAYWWYAAGACLVAWGTAMTKGATLWLFLLTDQGMFPLNLFAWGVAALLLLTPFMKSRPAG